MSDAPETPAPQDFMADVRSRHPHFLEAVLADARVNCAYRGERSEFRSRRDAILQAIATAATPPTPAGYAIKSLELGQARTYFEADGLVAHGVLTVEYLVRPAA